MDEDNSKKLQSLMEHLDTLYSERETFTKNTEIETVQYVVQRIEEIKREIELLKSGDK